VLSTFGTTALLSLFACNPTAKTPEGAAPGASLSAQRLTPPMGVTLVMACTPTGPELCFNAIDDNCNGVIDEGCGVSTGVLQFMIAWGDGKTDMDILLEGPNGVKITPQVPSKGGFKLDHDCPRDCGNVQNIENIFFEGLEPPRGHYTVEVKLTEIAGGDLPMKVRFGARVGSRTFGADLSFAQVGEKKSFGFDL